MLTLLCMAQRIPIILLELNTFAHALCALFIYCIWWDKPFEVDYPSIVSNRSLFELLALRWMSTTGSAAVADINQQLNAHLDNDELLRRRLERTKVNTFVPHYFCSCIPCYSQVSQMRRILEGCLGLRVRFEVDSFCHADTRRSHLCFYNRSCEINLSLIKSLP